MGFTGSNQLGLLMTARNKTIFFPVVQVVDRSVDVVSSDNKWSANVNVLISYSVLITSKNPFPN